MCALDRHLAHTHTCQTEHACRSLPSACLDADQNHLSPFVHHSASNLRFWRNHSWLDHMGKRPKASTHGTRRSQSAVQICLPTWTPRKRVLLFETVSKGLNRRKANGAGHEQRPFVCCGTNERIIRMLRLHKHVIRRHQTSQQLILCKDTLYARHTIRPWIGSSNHSRMCGNFCRAFQPGVWRFRLKRPSLPCNSPLVHGRCTPKLMLQPSQRIHVHIFC